MTALACVWRRAASDRLHAQCHAMMQEQARFGRSAPAVQCNGDIALGHSSFAPADGGEVPSEVVEGGGGRYLLVADARLDDRADLRRRLGLGLNGPAFTDGELIMAAWERHGEACFDQMYGEFALILWDRDRSRLYLARDPIGHRPLHFHHSARLTACASMPSGLHALSDVPVNPDLVSHAAYLAMRGEPGRRSFFEGVERVLPGEMLCLEAGGMRSVRYWRPNLETLTGYKQSDLIDRLRSELDEAVGRCLPQQSRIVATHLSAGLDSSAVCTSAAFQLPASATLLAFTAAPDTLPRDDRRAIMDESALAGATASLYRNVQHVRIGAAPLLLTDGLDRDRCNFQRPVGNPLNRLWIGRINDEVRRSGVKLLLMASFGNMGFSYDGLDELRRLLRRGDLLGFGRIGWRLVNRGGRPATRLIAGAMRSAWNPRRPAQSRQSALLQVTALSAPGIALLDEQGEPARRFEPADPGDRVRALQSVDPGNYNKGNLAGWGLETRDPLADRRLLEFCLRLPSAAFIHDGEPRALARGVIADRVPRAVLNERRRGIQSADWAEILERSLPAIEAELRETRASPAAAELLDLAKLERWLRVVREKSEIPPLSPYRSGIARALNAGHFLRRSDPGAHDSSS